MVVSTGTCRWLSGSKESALAPDACLIVVRRAHTYWLGLGLNHSGHTKPAGLPVPRQAGVQLPAAIPDPAPGHPSQMQDYADSGKQQDILDKSER